MRQIVLLRAINLGAHNRIAMPELRDLLAGAGYTRVESYLQSGNVVLESRKSPHRLARDCERAIRDGRMTIAESQALKRFYEGELNGYAYLESDGQA